MEEHIKRYLEYDNKHYEGPEDVRSIPVVDEKTYEEYIIPHLIENGAIPLDQLEVGKTYIGYCRNAHEATWNGKCFDYMRYNWGWFKDTIDHFDSKSGRAGTDVFVPIKIKVDEIEIEKQPDDNGTN